MAHEVRQALVADRRAVSAEYAATTRAKREGKAKGQQFVKQPDSIAKKVRPHRQKGK